MTQNYIFKALTSRNELEEVRELWQQNQWHPNADFEFFNLIVSTRPEILSPCVIVVYDRGIPISLLAGRIEQTKMPLRLGYATIAKISVRRLVVIEGAFMGDLSELVLTQILLYLDNMLKVQGLDYAYFEQIKIDSTFRAQAERILGATRFQPSHEQSEHWLMRLPKTWDEFLKTRSRKHRYWLKRLENNLLKEFPEQWTIRRYSSASETNDFATSAEAVAVTTYHRSLGVGFSLNTENLRRIELEASRGQLRGYCLLIKGEPTAFWYCTVFNNKLFLCSTGYVPAFRTYELGTVLLMKVFQDHCGTDIETVDFGLGEAGYKQRFGSEHFTEASHILFAKTLRARNLKLALSLTRLATKGAKGTLDRLKITQRFKTLWRRKLEGVPGDKRVDETAKNDGEAPGSAEKGEDASS